MTRFQETGAKEGPTSASMTCKQQAQAVVCAMERLQAAPSLSNCMAAAQAMQAYFEATAHLWSGETTG